MTQTVLTALNFLNGYCFASSLIQPKEVDERQIGQVFGMLLIIANALLAATQLLMAPAARPTITGSRWSATCCASRR